MAKYTRSWPLRQADPRWGDIVMWDRAKVIESHVRFNGATKPEADQLLRRFEDGNTIANEGCLLTCLAMVLRRLHNQSWTPKKLNTYANNALFYSRSGLSMVQLYADLVLDASQGEVQLCLKEEYLSGAHEWEPVYARDSVPVRAYLSLSRQARSKFMVMLKTGTYDDSIASHYVILDPAAPQILPSSNAPVIDPVMPLDATPASQWTLMDSARVMRTDGCIRQQWKANKIRSTQIAGVWVFARWICEGQPTILGELCDALHRVND